MCLLTLQDDGNEPLSVPLSTGDECIAGLGMCIPVFPPTIPDNIHHWQDSPILCPIVSFLTVGTEAVAGKS